MGLKVRFHSSLLRPRGSRGNRSPWSHRIESASCRPVPGERPILILLPRNQKAEIMSFDEACQFTLPVLVMSSVLSRVWVRRWTRMSSRPQLPQNHSLSFRIGPLTSKL